MMRTHWARGTLQVPTADVSAQDGQQWKNSVRHNLSVRSCFVKTKIDGIGPDLDDPQDAAAKKTPGKKGGLGLYVKRFLISFRPNPSKNELADDGRPAPAALPDGSKRPETDHFEG